MRLLCLVALLLPFAAYAGDSPKIDPAKLVSVTLSIQDWQTVLTSVEDSDRANAREANRISRTVISQIQPQLQAPTAPQKK